MLCGIGIVERIRRTVVGFVGVETKMGLGCDEYVMITLLGKGKGERDNCAHLLPFVPVTSSGVNVAKSLSSI
jgi:hypothetical protein